VGKCSFELTVPQNTKEWALLPILTSILPHIKTHMPELPMVGKELEVDSASTRQMTIGVIKSPQRIPPADIGIIASSDRIGKIKKMKSKLIIAILTSILAVGMLTSCNNPEPPADTSQVVNESEAPPMDGDSSGGSPKPVDASEASSEGG
jgi:hypothetical protein